jgi:SAM-dependent methyltransferase
MPDPHYEDPRLVELYDLECGWSPDRDFYLALAGAPPKRVLDLGCGTGLLCDAYAAQGHAVTGVDPAAAMLAVARRKPHGARVEWVHSNAESFRSSKRFDLIVMTGNAFQVLLDDDDIVATLAVMRDHLAPDGVVAFESRNPAIDWRSRWTHELELQLGATSVHVSRRVLAEQADRISFETRYAFPDEVLVSPSELRFLSRSAIEQRLRACGLRVESVCGDWNRQPFDPATSEEMIFTASRVPAQRGSGSPR